MSIANLFEPNNYELNADSITFANPFATPLDIYETFLINFSIVGLAAPTSVNVRINKIGGTCTLQVDGFEGTGTGITLFLGTIPERFRPQETLKWFGAYQTVPGPLFLQYTLQLNADGTLGISSNDSGFAALVSTFKATGVQYIV